MPGTTQTFIAFHATMLAKDKMAICSFVRTKAAEPRLVALLPQVEEVDDLGVQVNGSVFPSGFPSLLPAFLPFFPPFFLTSSLLPAILPPILHVRACVRAQAGTTWGSRSASAVYN